MFSNSDLGSYRRRFGAAGFAKRTYNRHFRRFVLFPIRT